MTILSGWQEQYERMLRSHSRLAGIAAGQVRASSDDARDALFHFFQDAFHLRDWIMRDSTAETHDFNKKSDFDLFEIEESPLRVCADLANGVKHYLRTKKSSYTSQDATVRLAAIGSGQIAAPHIHSWTVESGEKSYNAVDLANNVVSAWQSWLRNERLLQ